MHPHRTHYSHLKLLANRKGNFAINFALMSALIFLAAGLAVDYVQSLSNRTEISNALDAATLATGRALAIGEISTTGTDAQDYLMAIFAANVGDDTFDTGTYALENFTLDTDNNTLAASVSIEQPLTFLRIGLDKSRQTVTSSSEVTFGIGTIEVAMALDVTGSMGGSRITALKSAASLGITELLSANSDTEENVRISLVPYSKAVNAGDLADYVYPDYLDPTSDAPVYDSSYAAGYDVRSFQEDYWTCSYTLRNDGIGPYLRAGSAGIDLNGLHSLAAFSGGSALTDMTDIESRFEVARYRGSTATTVCTLPDDFIVEDDGTSVDDCATDRKAPTSAGLEDLQYTDENPSKGMISRDSRLPEDGCPTSEIVPLTSDETTLTNAVTGLATGGCTAGHIGLQWAWYTISAKWAEYLSTGSKPGDMDIDDDLYKYIILMSDGSFNTAYAGSSADDVSCAESSLSVTHTGNLCTNIKAQGIKIFTVGFGTSDSADSMLKSCASPDEGTFTYAYEPDTAAELKETYQAIASAIQALRLSR